MDTSLVPSRDSPETGDAIPADAAVRQQSQLRGFSAAWRLARFFAVLAGAIIALDAAITSGLQRLQTPPYDTSYLLIEGRLNASIVVTGSSRASSHYDPHIIERATARSAVNLGRNGSQTDLQLAILKAYLKHNRPPDVIVHNLDAFTFQTTHDVNELVAYVPYLYENEFYEPLSRVHKDIWKSRYLPLYGYVVEDATFTWLAGLRALFDASPHKQSLAGFDPRVSQWTQDFDRFKRENPDGVTWEIEPRGIALIDELIALCHKRGILLIFVYSPEYVEMQELTVNRGEVFDRFRALASRPNVLFWDYSNWPDGGNRRYFVNSQHLNAEGAALFSRQLSDRLVKVLLDKTNAFKPTRQQSTEPGHVKAVTHRVTRRT